MIFRNPALDFAVKLGCLDEDLLRFRLRRNVGEGVSIVFRFRRQVSK
jgi:hypothetical protein